MKWKKWRDNEIKAERAASDIQRELSNILLTEARDEDLKNVTITL